MSFPRYQVYKPSGLEWLQDVPAHWLPTQVKHVCSFTTGWTPPTGNSAAYEGSNLWANISDLGPKVLSECAKRISDDAVASAGLTLSKAGSLLFSFKLSIGQVSFAGVDMYTNEAIATFPPVPSIDLHYAYYSFPLFLVQNATENIYGAKLLNQQLIRSAPLILPSLNEQSAIAAFLDRETAKIDALVAEQEKLIALLKEKRQAVISHAVTKGLNPDAPMKPSGIEWLGDVPAHWSLQQFRRCVFIAEGQVDPEADQYRTMPLVAPNHVESGTGRLTETETAEEQAAESGKYLCQAGDVIYSKIRPALRKVCLAPSDCLCSADMYPLRPYGQLLNEYLLWFILSEQFSGLAVLESERVAMPKINRETLNEVPMLLPPLFEQHRISDHIKSAVGSIDRLVNAASEAISLLKERRSALISAAVTGQIDVRSTIEAEAA